MIKFRQGLRILGVTSLAWSAVGCAGHADTSRRLIDELGRAERSESDNQRRIADLEWRLREIEAQRDAESRRGSSRQLSAVVDRLDTLLAQNQQLLSATAAPGDASAMCTTAGPEDGTDAKTHLRYWAERLRTSSSGFRGGLTPEQNSALNVLLKRERLLDPKNPWPDL
jgi:hypothetical protein